MNNSRQSQIRSKHKWLNNHLITLDQGCPDIQILCVKQQQQPAFHTKCATWRKWGRGSKSLFTFHSVFSNKDFFQGFTPQKLSQFPHSSGWEELGGHSPVLKSKHSQRNQMPWEGLLVNRELLKQEYSQSEFAPTGPAVRISICSLLLYP